MMFLLSSLTADDSLPCSIQLCKKAMHIIIHEEDNAHMWLTKLKQKFCVDGVLGAADGGVQHCSSGVETEQC